MSLYAKELTVALLAAQRASRLAERLFRSGAQGIIKEDRSPVTIADYGVQALVISAIKHCFPTDQVVAEEDAATLRREASAGLRASVWDQVCTTRLEDASAEELLGGPVPGASAMLDLIDMGSSLGGSAGRFWVVDPIDGTKGFLRGGQYAICVALIVAGDVKLGVLACPNLPVDDSVQLGMEAGGEQLQSDRRGVLFSAVLDQGATIRPLLQSGLAEGDRICMRQVEDVSEAIFCESLEPSHHDQASAGKIAKQLGISHPSVRMDSQAKYGLLARGTGDIHLRLPVPNFKPYIWDYAAGDIIVREAGGTVTDIAGRRLDFGQGRILTRNTGIVAAFPGIHARVLHVVSNVLGNEACQSQSD